MRSVLLRCVPCSLYTMEAACPRCGQPTVQPNPPRYSPENRYGVYRRRLKYADIYAGAAAAADGPAETEKTQDGGA